MLIDQNGADWASIIEGNGLRVVFLSSGCCRKGSEGLEEEWYRWIDAPQSKYSCELGRADFWRGRVFLKKSGKKPYKIDHIANSIRITDA